MQSKTILYIIIAVVAISVIVFIGLGHKSAQVNATKSLSNQNQTNQSSKVLFSSSQYAPYSYLISGGNISSQARAALSGFNMTSTSLKNGTRVIVLSVIGTSISKNFTLASGYKLYIIETSFGDDGLHYDASLGDDGFVVTDPNGYIVA